MWLKLLIIFVGFGVSIAANRSARKNVQFRDDRQSAFMDSDDDSSIVPPLVDPYDGISYRLPNDTVPLSYDITLTTNIHLGDFAFNGQVVIRILCVNTTPEIVLQYRMMTIDYIHVMDSDYNLIEPLVPWFQNDTVEFLHIRPFVPFIQGQEYVVSIRYNGTIRNDGLGIYRASYIDPEGNRVWLASTQFQANEARHAFPCYDEPMIRSHFTLMIRHVNTYRALGNMNVVSITPEVGTNYVVTRFAQTPRMQSYLVAFTVSDFIYIENATVVPPQRIYGKTESIMNGEGEMALLSSIRQMALMEEYTEIDYIFPKMDQFACPNFAFGAMENSGLVLYREPFLLWDPILDRTRDKDNVITIIAHEFAHQWFGNLVNPAWWTYLWVNEGFAALYEFFLPHMTYPDDRYMDSFVIEYLHVAMENDANPAVRAMSHYVENPDRIEDLFDIVSYHKAGSVLRMIQHALGFETWRQGLNYFLLARKENFYFPAHIYAGLQQAVDEDMPGSLLDIDAIMSTWELQPGVPLITVTRDGDALSFRQDRFFYTEDESDIIFYIPINYVVGSNPVFDVTTPDFWLETRDRNIDNSTASKPWTPNDWIIVNIQQCGYYRVNYDNVLWNLITQQLNSPLYHQVHVVNRGQLIDDAFHVARSGRISFHTSFEIMNYLERETDFIPWDSADRALFLLNRWLLGTEVYDQFQAFVRKNIAAMYTRLGVNVLNNEPRLDRYARAIAINLACRHGSTQCLSDTQEQLLNMNITRNSLHADVVAPIYCNGVRQADANILLLMQDLLMSATLQIERNRIITGLGCIEDPIILQSHLSLALQSQSSLSIAERSNILSSPLNNGIGSLEVLMDFITLNYGGINLINPNLVSSLCSNIAIRVSTPFVFDRFGDLLTHLEINGAISPNTASSLRISAQSILEWQEENLFDIIEFFGRQQQF